MGMKFGYVGVPAPEVLEYDPWFGHPPETEKSIAIKETKTLEEEHKKLYGYIWEPEVFVEFENIHQEMYELATKNNATTLALNPMPDFGIGGSENFQGGSENIWL
jgi:hypothetical protein|tara:strand:- start:126 stop:440 length:315 start_codon:yes stop_codon:yes gene_type:complete